MTIRRMLPSDRAAAQKMWQEIFEEKPAFAAYYFENRFYPQYSFGAFENDALIAMTLGRPTVIRAENREHKALLVAGVSTLERYRGRGLMHALMTRLIDNAKESGFSCCYLHPVSESLYASLGFQNGTYARIVRSCKERAHKPFALKEGTRWNDLLSVYQTLYLTHDGMQKRDETECKTVFADYATDGAETLIAYAENRPVGYICYSETGEVFELFALCSPAYAFLLDKAAEHTGRELKASAPTDCGMEGERVYSMQYLVFDDAFRLPLRNGFCRLAY